MAAFEPDLLWLVGLVSAHEEVLGNGHFECIVDERLENDTGGA